MGGDVIGVDDLGLTVEFVVFVASFVVVGVGDTENVASSIVGGNGNMTEGIDRFCDYRSQDWILTTTRSVYSSKIC